MLSVTSQKPRGIALDSRLRGSDECPIFPGMPTLSLAPPTGNYLQCIPSRQHPTIEMVASKQGLGVSRKNLGRKRFSSDEKIIDLIIIAKLRYEV